MWHPSESAFKAALLRSDRATTAAEDAHTVVVAKGLAILVVFVSTAICGYLPFLLDRWFDLKNSKPGSKTAIVLRVMLFFGGGCLIGITFQHIVVELRDDIAELQADGGLPATAFDLGLFLMCIGFMIMFLVEELIHGYMHRHEKDGSHQGNGTIKSDVSSEHGGEDQRRAIVDVHLPPAIDQSESAVISALRGLLVVLALSIHALFEGVAVGLQTTAASTWYTTGAISGHKLVLAFIIGIELISAKVQLWIALTYVFIFTIVAPIGIAIGIGLSSDDGALVPSVIIQGLASGTLLYVAFFEILFKERNGLWTWIGFVLGFFLIFGIILGTNSPEKPVYCESTVVYVTPSTTTIN